MTARHWAAAAAVCVCAWAGSAGAATHTVSFSGVFVHPTMDHPITAVIDGVTATGDLPILPLYGVVASSAGSGGGTFTQRSITFTTGDLFTPVSIDLISRFTLAHDASCYSSACALSYDNIKLTGFRHGAEVAAHVLNGAFDPAYAFGAAFGAIDALMITALDPVVAPYPFCFDNACSETLISRFVLNDVVPAVPEPSTWAMMLFGFVGLALVERHRRDRQAA